jgi:hypothetical protein
MKVPVLIAVLVALLASGAVASTSSTTASSRQLLLYGHVKSLTRTAGGYRMQFDPAWWLSGTAAEQACGCKPVPNDHVVVDETHRLLTFTVRRDAGVTVVTRHSFTTPITVAELAQIVAGNNPKHRDLLEPKAGFWIRVGAKYPNPALSLEQQYQP